MILLGDEGTAELFFSASQKLTMVDFPLINIWYILKFLNKKSKNLTGTSYIVWNEQSWIET